MIKTVILAGGRGTRISEESHRHPKALVEIAGRPLLWHVMKIYSLHGINDFIICLGYKGGMIKQFVINYLADKCDLCVDLRNKRIEYGRSGAEPWTITLVDTGEDISTGGRLRRIRHLLDDDDPFCLTYCDVVADVDISGQLDFHSRTRRAATMTVVRARERFGFATVKGDLVTQFTEKPLSQQYVNGGFLVMCPSALEFLQDDSTALEYGLLPSLAGSDQLAAWRHLGFWQPVDTLRDKESLEQIVQSSGPCWLSKGIGLGVPAVVMPESLAR